MSDFAPRLKRSLANLALALLNATLLLIALCLFLAFRLADRVDDITHAVTDELGESLVPVGAEVHDLQDEIAGLRTDLAQLPALTLDAATSEATERLVARMESIGERLDAMETRLESARERLAAAGGPRDLLDHAIATAASEAATALAPLAGCRAAPADAAMTAEPSGS